MCALHYREYSARNLAQLNAQRSQAERRRRYGSAWREQRQRILNRDGNACIYCGTSERLEVHHLTDTDNPLDAQLVTLCYRHHRAIEAEGKRRQIGKIGNAVAQWVLSTLGGSNAKS
jgi:5-methylcytosine-specific restriction endonuclease McrA